MSPLKRLPFKMRIFLGCLFVAAIPLLFTTLPMVRIFDSSLNRQTRQEGYRQLDEACMRLQQMFAGFRTSCESLNQDSSAFQSLIDNKSIDLQKDLYLSLYRTEQENFSYAQFSLYDAGGKLRFTTDSHSAKPSSLPLHWGILRRATSRRELVCSRTDSRLVSDQDVVLQAVYPLENAAGVRAGYLVMDFPRGSFDRMFGGCFSDKDTLLLLDSYQMPVYCSNPELGEPEMLSLLRSTDSRTATRCQYLWKQDPVSGYYIFLCKDAQIGLSTLHSMQTICLLLAVICLGLCLLVSILLSRSIAQPVSALDQAMARVRDGDLSVRIHTDRQDELGRLGESFNQMLQELQENIDMKVQKQKDLNEATLKLYQTQLNPHFLYNTLDTIKWSARIHQNPDIPVLAENLAVILRQSIASDPFVTLQKELELVSNYIAIQKIRFAGRFLYETEVPDQLEQCLVPKMILQPLVENAILHGLEGRENGYICVYASQTAGRLLKIAVSDDGCGMPQDIVDWINSHFPEKRKGHVGLYNVIQILKLYYGQEYGLSAEVIPGEGTTITITLPLERR
jgi:two-component system sensor histidine kinase YesM